MINEGKSPGRPSLLNSYGRNHKTRSQKSRQRRASMQETYLRTLLKEEKDEMAKLGEEKEEEAQ